MRKCSFGSENSCISQRRMQLQYVNVAVFKLCLSNGAAYGLGLGVAAAAGDAVGAAEC